MWLVSLPRAVAFFEDDLEGIGMRENYKFKIRL
jgi:hypothetical protein